MTVTTDQSKTGIAGMTPSFTSLTVSGVASFADGTAAAPSVRIGDEQNGLYSSAANTLDVTCNGVRQAQFVYTAAADRYLTFTGSAGGNSTIGTSVGDITITTGLAVATTVNAAGFVKAFFATAIPAGGTTGSGLLVSSTANFGVFFGSGAPSLSAAKGSLYLRSDGSATNNRAYINTDGGTTWTALTTAA